MVEQNSCLLEQKHVGILNIYSLLFYYAKLSGNVIKINYPDLLKNSFSSSHRFIGKQPGVKPNISEVLLLNGLHDFLESLVSYTTLSCKEPPSLIFKGEKAALYTIILCEIH